MTRRLDTVKRVLVAVWALPVVLGLFILVAVKMAGERVFAWFSGVPQR